MSAKLKHYVGTKVFESLRHQSQITPEKLEKLIQIGGRSTETGPNLNISLHHLQKHLGISSSNEILTIKPDHIVQKIYLGNDRANRKIILDINPGFFVKDVLENIAAPPLGGKDEVRRIIVEYSSPNIAKPFHMGHLRSTIIGNFISNINKFLGNHVVRLNYLGDWGTQFGMLKLGVDLSKLTPDQIKLDPLRELYNAYVAANNLSKTDPSVSKKAREIFQKMESGQLEDMKNWRLYKQYTIDELNLVYRRLGVEFDEINYESMYNARDIQNVISKLEKSHLIHKEPDGHKFALIKDKKVPLVKKDGSMLYLTRDIAAALDRYKKYKFDQMLYVVDNSQSEHFNALHDVLFKLDLPWAGRIKHVKFGRIRGMSTRKGNAVFLKDILNEAKDLMKQSQVLSPNTKVKITDDHISDILGISCVIINDLKQRRQKDYDFDWSKVLQSQGDTGVRLQYTHCRLCSLAKKNLKQAETCQPELLREPEVLDLLILLAQFHEVLHKCHFELESAGLVVYLFRLCNSVNKALQTLRVKDEPEKLAAQRMMLFNVSKHVLGQGMKILGIKPLQEM